MSDEDPGDDAADERVADLSTFVEEGATAADEEGADDAESVADEEGADDAESVADEGEDGGENQAGEVDSGAPIGRAASDVVDVDVDADLVDPAALGPEETVELGVELLAHAEDESLSLADAMDRIETVTTTPSLTREILDEAELRGVIEREAGRVRFQRGGTYVSYTSQVVRREGDYDCRRCGASISTGHFVQFEAGELGPFGPECVRKVTGRESED